MKARLFVILLAGISMVGCTTMRTVDSQPANLTEQIEVGDHLVVYEKSGRIVDMTVSVISDTTLEGTLAENTFAPVTVVIDDIEKIEVEKIDGAKTTLAVVGGTIIILPLAFLALLAGGYSSY